MRELGAGEVIRAAVVLGHGQAGRQRVGVGVGHT